MKTVRALRVCRLSAALIIAVSLLTAGCAANETSGAGEIDEASHAEMLELPEVSAIELSGRPLRVVATTSIIGDVVSRVGMDNIDLVTLIGPGQDPHSFEPGAQDLALVSEADIIFVNGWDLEEALIRSLETIGGDAFVVPVSAGVEPLEFGAESEEHGVNGHPHGAADPHVWFDVRNVETWAANIASVLGGLDPTNSQAFQSNAAAYRDELVVLAGHIDSQLVAVPDDKRLIVTNHDSLGYFAAAYGFEVVGTVVPAASTLAEPSAGELAALITAMSEHGVCVVFSETTMSDSLARSVAAELDDCEEVSILSLYTGAVGPPGSGADSYIGMMRANLEKILAGLSGQ